mgnify:CR=1 FL=1
MCPQHKLDTLKSIKQILNETIEKDYMCKYTGC